MMAKEILPVTMHTNGGEVSFTHWKDDVYFTQWPVFLVRYNGCEFARSCFMVRLPRAGMSVDEKLEHLKEQYPNYFLVILEYSLMPSHAHYNAELYDSCIRFAKIEK